MKAALPLLVSLVLALAGCMTPSGGDDGANNETAPGGGVPVMMPEPIEDSQTVTGGADPLNFAGQPVCSSPTSACIRYPFELNGSAQVVAGLSWGVPANDFDLYVFQDGEQTDTLSGNTPPGTTEAIDAELEAGSYEIVVVPWSVAQDTYTLTVTFTAAGGNETAETNTTALLLR